MTSTEALVDVLRAFARTLVTHYEVGEVLDRLCDHCIRLLPISSAGVTLAQEEDGLRLQAVAASDSVAERLEQAQLELGEGPCLDAWRRGAQILVPDLARDPRYPAFAQTALAAGIRAAHSVPLRFEAECVGALNLFAGQPLALTEQDAETAQVLADVATAYILHAQTVSSTAKLAEQLQHALESRVVIEQAKGRLAERLGVSVDEAFDYLRRYSRSRGLRLRHVAADVAADRLTLDVDAGE